MLLGLQKASWGLWGNCRVLLRIILGFHSSTIASRTAIAFIESATVAITFAKALTTIAQQSKNLMDQAKWLQMVKGSNLLVIELDLLMSIKLTVVGYLIEWAVELISFEQELEKFVKAMQKC